MRLLLLLTLATASGCGTLRSGLEIDPGATFVLGGEQRGAFTVEILNTGAAPVALAELQASGDTLQVTSLAPGEGARVRFARGSAALLRNASPRPASLDVTVTGDTKLGMRYIE